MSKFKILIAKSGLNGHDRGAKVVYTALKEAGFDVLYTGRHRSIDEIVDTAIKEGVDVIGLSILSGVHLEVAQGVLKKLKERNYEAKVVVGGVIPEEDVQLLKQVGVIEVFNVGSRLEDIVKFFKNLAESKLKEK